MELFKNATKLTCAVDFDQDTNDVPKNFRILVRDEHSAQLDVLDRADGVVIYTLILDLLCRVVKNRTNMEDEGPREDGKVIYRYMREDQKSSLISLDVVLIFRSIVTDPAESVVLFRSLDYLLGQYTIFHELSPVEGGAENNLIEEDSRRPNNVARILESSGMALRQGLKASGKATGSAIRAIGKKYTAVTHQPGTVGASASLRQTTTEPDETNVAPLDTAVSVTESVDSRAIASAVKHQARAEAVHAGARTLTSAALFPVRYIGKQASKYASPQCESKSKTKKALLDVCGGLGNGAAHAFKGLTEAISEVGNAVGDAAMHHATTTKGEQYANQITKKHVDAASEIGLACYKVGNVASFGLHGYLLDAIIEGTALSVSLYEYLVGPILLQGCFPVTMVPSTTPKMYFVVLRPWSIAMYSGTADICGRPAKVIACCMLDTIPIVRRRPKGASGTAPTTAPTAPAETTTVAGPTTAAVAALEQTPLNPSEGTLLPTSVATDASDFAFENLPMAEAAAYLSESEPAAEATAVSRSNVGNDDTNPMGNSSNSRSDSSGSSSIAPIIPPSSRQIASSISGSYLKRVKGGDHTHIELCTVDCSTYLLYPPRQADLNAWYTELKAAAERVETIEKRKSGAVELAMLRRLALLPKKRTVSVTLLKVVISPDRGSKESLYEAGLLSAMDGGDDSGGDTSGGGDVGADADTGTVVASTPVEMSQGRLVCCPQVQQSLPSSSSSSSSSSGGLSLADRIRNSALRSCYVRMRTTTSEGTKAEEEISEKAALTWEAEEGTGALAACWPSSRTSFGRKLSLEECERICLTLRAETIVGKSASIEIGRCSVPLDTVAFGSAAQEQWVDVLGSRGNGRCVARLFVRIVGTNLQ